MNLLVKVARSLKQHKMPYAVVGGHAVAIHGAIRGTVDIDLITRWSKSNLERMEAAMSDIGLVSRLPITASNLFDYKKEYMENKNLFAWNFYNPKKPLEQVDLVLTHDLSAVSTKSVQIGEKDSLKIISLKDLIIMKKKAGRPQDLEDVKALELIQKEGLS